jgi:hypothetical protein
LTVTNSSAISDLSGGRWLSCPLIVVTCARLFLISHGHPDYVNMLCVIRWKSLFVLQALQSKGCIYAW